jgi:hypothetical protein
LYVSGKLPTASNLLPGIASELAKLSGFNPPTRPISRIVHRLRSTGRSGYRCCDQRCSSSTRHTCRRHAI